MFQTTYNSEEKVWSGNAKSSVFNPNISVGQALLWSLQKNPKKIAQISDNNGVKLTQEELRLKSIRAAQNILKLGYKEGDMIGVIAKNSHNLAPIVFAALSIGCPVNTLDPTFECSDIIHMFSITKPKLVFCDEDNLDRVRESLSSINLTPRIYIFDKVNKDFHSVDDLLVETHEEHTFLPISIKDGAKVIAAIVCSSGTTGLSKGVCLTHASLLDRMDSLTDLSADDTTFCYSSLYWLSGLATLLFSTLHGGTRVITTAKFSPDNFLKAIEKYKVTFVMTPPSQLALTLKHATIDQWDLSSVRYYMCGGSIVAEDLCKQIRKYLPNGDINVGYGLSEIGGIATCNLPPKSGSVGLLANGVQMKIIDDNGRRLGVNERGEICMKLPYKFVGYYGNESTSKNAFDKEDWFLTGDIGYLDEDGYVYINERKKDILKYSNYQITPSEIENCLIEHPAIKQVSVVGIPDVVYTDLPAAVIVINDNAKLTEKEVQEFAAARLADYKRLRGGVYFVKSLPMTPSGKLLKQSIKNIAIELHARRLVENRA